MLRNGKGNTPPATNTRTIPQIIRKNLFTYFNLIYLILTVMVVAAGSYKSLTFLPAVIANTLIGTIQEISAKRTIDRLTIINEAAVPTLRDGVETMLPPERLVLGDVVIFRSGMQIPADAEVLDGQLSVNEALLTGEADEIEKKPGSELFSGSFVVSGECRAVLIRVGDDEYASKLIQEAREQHGSGQSEMVRDLNTIILFTAIAIVPMGLALFCNSYYSGAPFRDSIESVVAVVVGMIPQGLTLLFSTALAISAVRLGRKKVLLHDMRSVETLARVDVLCVDKTGTITKGTPPYDVTWLNGKHEVMRTAHVEYNPDAWCGCASDEVGFTPEECDDYIAIVTDANGIEGRDTVRVIVTGDAITATFENLYLDEESYWYGSDQRESFVSGSYLFDNTNLPEWSYWSEFAYANRTATDFASLYPDQFNNAVGGGHGGSDNYVVAYPYSGRIQVMNKEADVLRGFYVTNDAWTVDAILHGDGMTPGVFHTGDYLKIIITGTHPDGTTSSKEYYLADYRDADDTEHYYINTWQWVDLRELGEVTSISFKMDGNRADQYGLTTPAYFCLDDFNGEREVKDVGTMVIDDELDVASLFDFTEGEGRIVYDFADQPEQEVLDALELTPEGMLYVSGYSEPFELVLQAVQRGKIQFVKVRVEVNLPSSITELNLTDDAVEGIYTTDGKKVDKPTAGGVYIVKTKDGRWRKVKQ